ncbi:MAG: subtilisin-like serine protease QhpE [Blastocatellia bacterium]
MDLQSPFAEFTGRGVRVAIIDSGVNPAHPHVGGVAGGVGISASGESENYLDYAGHGTAVAGAIREKAPDALLFAVKVFDQDLRTNAETIVRAMEWAVENRMQIVNLSLGTINPSHRDLFERVVVKAVERNVAFLAAGEMLGQPAFPGCLPGAIAVGVDWECPRETYRVAPGPCFLTSGYPREIPGVPREYNLSGISFAVANMTGYAARAREAYPTASVAELKELLQEHGLDHRFGH